ncbi:hypothetical protein Bbelb_068980 [Branchiostoma belcheri]|nr:hypothetical protein Bbelb_068980 [Branchiostoma belcheri]
MPRGGFRRHRERYVGPGREASFTGACVATERKQPSSEAVTRSKTPEVALTQGTSSFNQSFDNLFVDENLTWINETVVVSEEEESTVDWVFIRTLVVVLALSVTVLLGTVTLVYNFVCFERAPQQRRR